MSRHSPPWAASRLLDSSWARLLVAVAGAGAAIVATAALAIPMGRPYFFVIFPAVMGAGLLVGSGPALLTTALFALFAAWHWLPPQGQLAIEESPELFRLAGLVASAALVALVSGRVRTLRARERGLTEAARSEAAARGEAERAARDSAERLGALQQLTAALSAARTPDDVARVVFTGGFPLLGARAGSICYRTGEDALTLIHSANFAEDARRDFEVVSLGAPLPTAEAARTGEAIWLGSPAEIDARYPALSGARARWRSEAWACLPLKVNGAVLGVLGLSFTRPHAFDPLERGWILSVAELTAQAFDRARLYDAELAARQRAEAAEAETRRTLALQEQLLGVIGHDLRTPLSAISMATSVIRLRGPLAEGQGTALDRISRSAARMASIIRDLLDLARARQALGMALSLREVDAAEISRQVIAELQQVHPGRTLRLECSGEATLPADPSRLAQAISNLVSNALQHGEPAGAISVAVAGEASTVRVEVHNAGRPIAAELRPTLFEPFHRSAAGPGATGLGLGLFIAREIARAHGGDVTFRSEDGHGTTFALALPREAEGVPALTSSLPTRP